ncbi:MAG: hypothetical protein NZ761_09070 [Dehalococcoidia bacterium]|nr:hypothetical protein [Dehalococcoidia bacterium]
MPRHDAFLLTWRERLDALAAAVRAWEPSERELFVARVAGALAALPDDARPLQVLALLRTAAALADHPAAFFLADVVAFLWHARPRLRPLLVRLLARRPLEEFLQAVQALEQQEEARDAQEEREVGAPGGVQPGEFRARGGQRRRERRHDPLSRRPRQPFLDPLAFPAAVRIGDEQEQDELPRRR